jgi:signal peptidase I
VNWRRVVRLLFWIAVVCAVLVGIVFIFFDSWTVPGDDAQFAVSIEPTLGVGDVVLVTRASGAGDGALVRCTDPDAPARFVVGRVVGDPGDTVEFTNGTLMVNNRPPSASSACDPAIVRLKNPGTQDEEDLSCLLEELGGGTHMSLRSAKNVPGKDTKVTVEAGKVFLASDNRPMHLDSRDYNMIAPASCHHIALRLWSAVGWSDTKKRFTVLW